MDWCRLSTSYYLDGHLLRAGEAAEVLFLRCIAYSGAQETRGRVPRSVLPMLTPAKTSTRLAALLAEGLVVEDGNDVVIRSWDKHQEALDAASDRKERDRARKAAQRKAAREGTVHGLSADSPCDVRVTSANKEGEGEGEKEGTSGTADAAPPTRSDVEGLCRYFLAALDRNDVKAKVTDRWKTEARLLLDRDKRDPAEIRAVIDWATQDSFWRANVLSVPKLREKYDQLRLAMLSSHSRPAVSQGMTLEQQRRRL